MPYPEGEARRQEVIRAFDAWEAACQEVRDAVGFTAAAQANDAACKALNEVEDDVERLRPRSVAGIVAKAQWVVAVADAMGSNDPFGRFVRQVAALGEVAT